MRGEYVPSGHCVEQLPELALSNPRDTLVHAEAVLARSTDTAERSYAAQARGIALRELGDVPRAVRSLRTALTHARQVSPARASDAAASLAVTLAVAGRSAEALRQLDEALSGVDGTDAARIRVRQGSLLGELGRPVEAARSLRVAARVLERAGDRIWELRARLNLALAFIEVGDTQRAEQTLLRAESLVRADREPYEAAVTRQYRGLVAALDGRTPDALRHYDVAARRFERSGTSTAELLQSRASALLAAGMVGDALASAQESIEVLRRPGSSPAFLASALVKASDAALAAGRADLARTHAAEALRLFRRQGRDRGATLARLAAARARHAGGERGRSLLRELTAVADDAAAHRMPEAVEANLLAGDVALDVGAAPAAATHLARARRARTGRSETAKVLGWHAAALTARAAGRPAATLRACDAGLAVLEAHQATLGAIEMRAAATTHGLPLARLAVRAGVESADPAAMLRWVERWRSTTLRLAPVRLPDDPQLGAELAQLRLARLRLDEATAASRGTAALLGEIVRLERAVRDRTHRSTADGARPDETFDLTDALAGLDGATLVEIFLDGDDVHVLVADADGVRHQVAGSHAAAQRATEFARFSLRRMTHRAFSERARASLPGQAAALQQAVLGAAADRLGDGPVVLVPPASLSSAPWGVLPALRERSVCVAASASSWWSARQARPASDTVVLAAGPDLAQAEAEVEQLAAMYPAARVLAGGAATTDATLAALDGAALAHVAAHGTFRSDNPLFSALLLDDGPLTVYDLQRLRRAPHRLVLSCCDSGTVSAAGADEVLGLASALVPLGMAGMIAAAVPVSDQEAVPFALRLHERLRAGASSGEALRDARLAAGSPAAYALAHSFMAFGAS